MVGEKDFSKLFAANAPYWHLCTPGQLSGILFSSKEDYVYAMNLIALCAALYLRRVKIYTFQVMSNHLHFVLSGSKENVLVFFDEFHRRLHRFYASGKELHKLRGFKCNLFEINDMNYLRNVIAYVNRNGFVVNRHVTPFSYLWGPNRFFFFPDSDFDAVVPIAKVSQKERQRIFRTHYNDFPDNYFFTNGYISPVCYCHISECEAFFHDAHQYFHYLSRRVESFSEIANQLGDKIVYTDDEVFSAAIALSVKNYDIKKLGALGPDQRTELARNLHFTYHASNKQICRVLGLDKAFVDAMFPVAK